MVKNGMRPIHPDEILLEEFLHPSDPPINANTLPASVHCVSEKHTLEFNQPSTFFRHFWR